MNAIPIRPGVETTGNPRYRQLLEFCGTALIDSMESGELPDGVVLVVIDKAGTYTASVDVEMFPISHAMIVAGTTLQDNGIRLMREADDAA